MYNLLIKEKLFYCLNNYCGIFIFWYYVYSLIVNLLLIVIKSIVNIERIKLVIIKFVFIYS